MDFATFTPPPLPRPPAWICAFTTHTLPPSFFAASTASSTLNAAKPRGVGRPYLRKISFPWYSWIFIVVLSSAGSRARGIDGGQALPAALFLRCHFGYHLRTVSLVVSSAWHWSSWNGLRPSSRSSGISPAKVWIAAVG